jgi:hypothetical protein
MIEQLQAKLKDLELKKAADLAEIQTLKELDLWAYREEALAITRRYLEPLAKIRESIFKAEWPISLTAKRIAIWNAAVDNMPPPVDAHGMIVHLSHIEKTVGFSKADLHRAKVLYDIS